MEAKLQRQQITSETIRKIVTNFKKDSAKRKSAEYINKRLEALEDLWTEFELNHTILSTSLELKANEYFTSRAYDKVKQEYEAIREVMMNWQGPSSEEKGIPSKTDELMSQQNTNFRAFMRVVNNIKIADPKETWDIEDKLQTLQARWKVIDELHWHIDNLLVGTELDYEEEYTKHESVFEATKRELHNILYSTKHRYQAVPQIEIPTFSGNYAQWPTFMDLFSEAIHTNTLLTKAQKMQHLKGKLRGEAERLVQHLNISAENYDTCWEILTHRYHNIQLLFTKQIQIFMNQPAVQQQTSFELKRLHDTSLETIHAIYNLGVNTTTWDPILVHILTGKLDPETYTSYMEMRKAPRELPSFEELIKFLESKFTALEPVKKTKTSSLKPNNTSNKEFTSFKSNLRTYGAQTDRTCPICKTHHLLAYCKVFRNMSPNNKLKTLKQLHICQNCMYSHNGKECTSSKTCKTCNNKHHTLLHDVFATKEPQTNEMSMTAGIKSNKPSTSSEALQRQTNHVAGSHSEVLLATILLKVAASDGTYVSMRCLLDQGSQINLITESAAQRLGLQRRRQKATVLGVGMAANQSHGTIQLQCESLYGDYAFTTEASVMTKVLDNLPNYSFEKQHWPHLYNINLADPDYNISRPVDILLDASVYAEIVLEGILRGPRHAPIAQQTRLGWILLGNVTTFNCHAVLNNLDDIALFWESEEITEDENTTSMTPEEQYCEELYRNTTRRLTDGRYEVRIPMKPQFQQSWGESKPQAIAQFRQLEKRLAVNASLSKNYKEFIQEYLALGHMKLSKQTNEISCFLPHHGVVKLDSTTTKLRVVFNASSKTRSGYSLNQLMECGPKLQQDLQALILRWRTYRFAYTADIEKFYRQIRVHEQDQSLQKIVWRDCSNDTIQEYQLCTVTYGTKAAPFLAMRTIQQLVEDDGHLYPLAADVLSNHRFVDDILSGSHSLQEACTTQQELIKMLEGGGLTLRKWASNNRQFLSSLPQEWINQNMFNFKQAENNKALGIKWNPCSDQFTFKQVNDTDDSYDITTKRSLLSDLSKLYDPLGWLSPVTIRAKIIFQQVWIANISWDEPLPEHIREEWKIFRQELPHIHNITIPRWIGNTLSPVELHGFCDASEKAYGCVIYCKSADDKNLIQIRLVAGKTKLVPVKKPVSLPRLELCAAQLLSRLMKKVTESISVQTATLHAWSDSMVVLGWLYGDSSRWKPFVANRVRSITENLPSTCWKHLKSADNPADCASRGVLPSKLLSHPLWWEGPAWLKTGNTPLQQETIITHEEENKHKKVCATEQITLLIEELLQKHSSMVHIIRVLSWILRFINNSRNKGHMTQTINLSTAELANAHNIIIKTVQHNCFNEVIARLRNSKQVQSMCNLLSLNPVLDKFGILRVGGRLNQSLLSESSKHPAILPNDHRLTGLLIQQAHQQTLHGGARLTLSHLRNKYWILGGIRTVKKQLLKCVKCHRYKQMKNSQIMADLPKPRVTPSRPFTHTGVDFTGRVEVKANKGRGIKTTAGYIAIFICLCTKAIHLELVSDLSTITFLAALKRLCARRGTPSHIYSDNGTNFVGAAKTLLKEYKEALQHYVTSEIIDSTSNLGITWHFNAPAWPSAGGLWEAAVKSMKHHLKRVLGEQKLTFEEFSTLLAQIEACLNSRPLIAITDDVEDLNYLTPGHFLVGGPVLAPPGTIEDTHISLTNRWKLTAHMHRDFWKRWSSDYLQSLQPRSKWYRATKNLEVGDVVLVKEDNIPPGRWLLGRVTGTHPGADGRVRVVTVKTKNNILKRPVTKLTLLPIDKNIADSLGKQTVTETTLTKQTRKNRSTSLFTYLCIFFLCLMTCTASPVSQFFNITELETEKLVYFDKVADMHVIQDQWTMVVYYNMSSYWQSLTNLEQYVSHLKGLCRNDVAEFTIATQFQHEIDELKHYNNILRSEHGIRTRRGLINGVGYVANSLFGVLDERFANKYRKDIKYLQDNENHLLNLYKQHTSLIEGEYNLLKRNEEVMHRQFSLISRHLKQIDNQVKVDRDRMMYFTTSILAANMIISNLHRIQGVLLDLVTDVRNGRLDTHLLRPDEFQQQLNIISRQIPNELSIPCINDRDCIQQMYKLSRVHMRVIEDYLIFEVKLPLISNEQYELNRVIPIPRLQGEKTIRIIPTSVYLAVNLRKDLLLQLNNNDVSSCEHLSDYKLICSFTLPEYNIKATTPVCEAQLINNRNISSCNTVAADCYDEWIRLHSRGAWLFSCCGECQVRIFCPAGLTSQALHKTGVITLSEGCILKSEDILIHAQKKFQNTVNINRDTEYWPESGINHIINHSIYTFMPEDHSDQFRDIKHGLEMVKRQQTELTQQAETHVNHHYAMYAISLVVSIIVGAYGVLKLKQFLQDKRQANEEPDIKTEPVPEHSDPSSDDNSTHTECSSKGRRDTASSPVTAHK